MVFILEFHLEFAVDCSQSQRLYEKAIVPNPNICTPT